MAEQYRSLMARYQAGEGAAFEALYCRLAPELRRMMPEGARADEMVEQVFIELHRARRSYDPAKPFAPWLMAIVRHVLGARPRARTRRSLLELLGRWGAPRVAH